MSFLAPFSFPCPCWLFSESAGPFQSYGLQIFAPKMPKFAPRTVFVARKLQEEVLVVVGGGAAGVYGAIRAKTVASNLKVVVFEKRKFLSKVKISGGGRCNLTNGHFIDKMILAEHYPRGNKELKGSFFDLHGPVDTMSWFSEHGVELKIEDDGRVFPTSDSSSSIIDCLLFEAEQSGVLLQIGEVVTATTNIGSKFLLRIEKCAIGAEDMEADYLLIASGSSLQGFSIATQLGHSIVNPVPSLFTFKIKDSKLLELSGVTFPKVKVKLKLGNVCRNIPQLTQVGPMLVTHWGVTGPVILRLSAWGARHLFGSDYKGTLLVDFVPHLHKEDVKSILIQRKHQLAKHKLLNSRPSEFCLPKRFWKYILEREGLSGDIMWNSVSNNSFVSIAYLLKQCLFGVVGKGQFKDEFVTAGGVPLSEIDLNTMQSRIQERLFFAGEVLNVDGITGGFNFQNAWSGGYIAGTSIGRIAAGAILREDRPTENDVNISQ